MTIRLALLSYWHVHAKDYEREALANPETSISVVWDEIPERGADHADRIGARFEPSLEAISLIQMSMACRDNGNLGASSRDRCGRTSRKAHLHRKSDRRNNKRRQSGPESGQSRRSNHDGLSTPALRAMSRPSK